MKVRVKKIPKAQNGADLPENTGVDPKLANSELEAGEVYQTQQGDLQKVSDDGNTHEEGGEAMPDVHRVLEDTSDKRNDEDSKALKIKAEDVKKITGYESKKDLSHSKAFEKSVEYWDGQLKSIETKLNKNLKSAKVNNDMYAKNSLDFNVQNLKNIPTKADIFDALFNHQEDVKAQMGISDAPEKAQFGARYALAFGKPKPDVKSTGKVSGDTTPTKTSSNYTLPEATVSGLRTRPDVRNTTLGTPPFPLSASPANIQNTLVPTNPLPDDLGAQQSSNNQNTGKGAGQQQQGFNEPLNWFDVASPIMNLLDSSRIPVQYNPVNLQEAQVRLLDPRPAMQANQEDFNAAVQNIPGNDVGDANRANLLARKYSVNNQILGQYENLNKGKLDQRDVMHADVRNRQEASDQAARETFEQKYLKSIENQRLQKSTAFNDLFDRVAQNQKLNREGNLILKMIRNYDQYGNLKPDVHTSFAPVIGSNLNTQTSGAPQTRVVPVGTDAMGKPVYAEQTFMNGKWYSRNVPKTSQNFNFKR